MRAEADGARHRLGSSATHGNLKSNAAQTALQDACARIIAHQVKTFYRNHHLTVTTARMRDGAGGWMGLGGMWGGFGW